MKAPAIEDLVLPGFDNELMGQKDTLTLWVFAILTAVSILSAALITVLTDYSLFEVLPVIALPFFLVGVSRYIMERRWLAMVVIACISFLVYILDPVMTMVVLYALVCAEGVAVAVELLQRLLFFRIFRTVEFVNAKQKLTVWDRAVVFLFNIPCDLDTRNLTMNNGIRRNKLPWKDMLKTMLLALSLSVFLWMYMFLNPAFSVNTSGALIYTFTVVMYVAVLVMPWSIFNTLEVRIVTENRDFSLYSGLMETMKRMFLPTLLALLFFALALSNGGYTLYYVASSIVMIVVMITSASVMYYTRNEAAVVNDITEGWKRFHPAQIYAGYEECGHRPSMDDGVPGTPVRDVRSCFDDLTDQKY